MNTPFLSFRMQANLLDEYEYGMCGKVFKYEYLEDRRVYVTMESV